MSLRWGPRPNTVPTNLARVSTLMFRSNLKINLFTLDRHAAHIRCTRHANTKHIQLATAVEIKWSLLRFRRSRGVASTRRSRSSPISPASHHSSGRGRRRKPNRGNSWADTVRCTCIFQIIEHHSFFFKKFLPLCKLLPLHLFVITPFIGYPAAYLQTPWLIRWSGPAILVKLNVEYIYTGNKVLDSI